MIVIILFCQTHVSDAQQNQWFILIERFMLRPTVPEFRESELPAFVELYASICLENEWLAQKFLAHNKASIALVITINCCCNPKESARNSVKICFFFSLQDSLPISLLVFISLSNVSQIYVSRKLLWSFLCFPLPWSFHMKHEFTVVYLTLGLLSFWRERQLFYGYITFLL